MSYVPDIWAFDYILACCYLVIISLLAFAYQKSKVDKEPQYKYFMRGLYIKVAGGMGFLLLTVYYWGGGDTYSYFNAGRDFLTYILEEPTDRFKLFLSAPENMNWYKYKFAYGRHAFLTSSANFTTVKITALVNMLGFQSYVVSTLLFSVISFLGIWNMYYVFCRMYPKLQKHLFYGFFFIPSVLLWGSGILKDTITLASVGFIVYSFMNIVVLARKRYFSFILIIIATITIASIKPYILYVLYPCLFIWVQSNLKRIITHQLIRRFMAPFFALSLVVSSYFLTQELSESAGKYNIDQLEDTLEGFQTWHTTVSEVKHQSGYSLGDMDYTTMGVIRKIPAAFEVTFFRPYLWEVNNPSTLLGALEGTILLCFSLWLIIKYRLSLFRLIIKNKDILFLLLFATLFGISVGISSYNFGALSRYKIPAQLFFVLALVLIHQNRSAMEMDQLNRK